MNWTSENLTDPTKWYDLDAFKTDANFYGKWQQELSNSFHLFSDLQYRRVKYDLNGFRNNPAIMITNTYDFLNPKIGFSYQKNKWTAYASYSVANKEPNRDDYEAGLLQQPKPEHLHDIEAGIANKHSKRNWSANFYYMQ